MPSERAAGRTPGWAIAPYVPADRDAVIALISGIQRGEFGLAITPADQPDLMDIDGFYVRGALGPGGFWTAREVGGQAGGQAGGSVLGCIALLNIGNAQGALRKMFVAQAARGTGLAAALLGSLTGWCAVNGLTELFLGTTDRFLAAHRFYAKHGFVSSDKAALPPAFPVMAVDTVFFRKRL